MKISVITVSFNSEKTIAQTIESVLNQTYDNYEYIIIDGKSDDSTVEIAESYRQKFAEKNVSFEIVSEKDNGIYDAMNKGITKSSGDIVGIVNSDDFYETDALERVAKFHEETGFDLMYADLRVFRKNKVIIKKSRYKKRFNTRFWNHPTTFVTKAVYNDLKYACESIYDDLDFMLSAISRDLKICILNEVLSNYRLGGIGSKKTFQEMRKRIRIRNSIYKKHNYKGYRLNNLVLEFLKYLLG